MEKTAKQQAIEDLSKELKKQGKSFISFRTDLNPIMDKLVSDYEREQRHVSFCLSSFSKLIKA
jgi:hypothetical protein